MNDTKQPEPLRLAEQLRDMSSKFKTPSHERGVCNGAMQELRRLHAEVERITAIADDLQALCDRQALRIAELEAAVAPTETLPMTMCADQHCPEYGTCYRAQAKPTPDQRFWAVSPREDNSCRFYAPIYFTNGLVALREDAQ